MASSGCHAPGPHAISTRTAHTTTTSSIDRVPKTVGRIPGSTLPSAIATGWGVCQSTVYMYLIYKAPKNEKSECSTHSENGNVNYTFTTD